MSLTQLLPTTNSSSAFSPDARSGDAALMKGSVSGFALKLS